MRYLALHHGVARLEDDGSVAVLETPVPLATLLCAGRPLAELGALPVARRCAMTEVTPAPITAAGAATWGIGLNYRSKQRASGRTLPEHPTFFMKAPSSFTGPGGAIPIPASAPDCVDYEGEIAVVVGTRLFCATAPEAARAVAALAAANDVTARDVMRATGNPSLAKSYPGFGQLGATVLDPDAAGGVGGVELSTVVNGELRQSDTGAGMIIPVDELLSMLSQYVVLRPGDVVLTGTPSGTGDETKSYLAAGDVVEVRLGGLPPLTSRVVDGATRDEDEDGDGGKERT